MSAFTKAKKSFQKNHKERGQLQKRNKLGLLEKHKDYVLRARDYHKKQASLKTLKEKALNRNPDEFYFKMVNQKTKDGVHHKTTGKKHAAKQLKTMKSQDLSYFNTKRNTEMKKIEKLQANLHLLEDHDDETPPNQHIIFVDNKKEARAFDAAKHFDTLPELVSRTYNRPKLDTLQHEPVCAKEDKKTLKKLAKRRNQCYEELKQRIERKEKMTLMVQKLELQKHLMGKGHKRKVKEETDEQPAVYRWKKKRQK
ncbi:probable U3 small nucleolar RNA-associated protein 11 [Actinia tenebrosa]|uniref:U3 small nucleolar RNA-associated protein 11 n=1 Tax=Actinia tenebrosa TaxID=6105 RepID=A0A6P8HF52_ACTTE|nr:probable U3 small nucleolar RNA-associated protein 11 [Actinia tenebrosa]